jgi:hypothetical protein
MRPTPPYNMKRHDRFRRERYVQDTVTVDMNAKNRFERESVCDMGSGRPDARRMDAGCWSDGDDAGVR